MLESLHIENFRGFQEFELENLGRINLLVGENNSGKTSILEAIKIFSSHGNLNVIAEFMKYRGEYLWNTDLEGNLQQNYLIFHLFYGHQILEDFELKIRINSKDEKEDHSLSIKKYSHDNLLLISRKDGKQNKSSFVELSSNNCISSKIIKTKQSEWHDKIEDKTQLIMPSFLNVEDLIKLFDNVVLSPREKLIIEALKIIEPRIERIASVGQAKYSKDYNNYGERGGFLVKFSDQNQPVPIGSLGEGMWCILSIILEMLNLENGVLLVDKIDTGLHYKTLLDMWKMILFTARKLNIQVFATTHNSDCWKSLAQLIKKGKIQKNEITIQRIELNRKKSISFSPEEIMVAAETGIEVR